MRIFIGYDPDETIAYHVACHSIMEHATRPVSITALNRSSLPMFHRTRGNESTDFSYSRFLVPYLCNYKGHAIFLDCDVLLRGDIWELITEADLDYSVSVVKHDYVPKDNSKFMGHKQLAYHKKNWSSVMVFNNAQCRALTLDKVHNASGMDLHQFKWLSDDMLIGSLDEKWNYLVGEYPKSDRAKLVHFTLGTPCFAAYKDCDYADEWYECRTRMMYHNRAVA